jgi:serine/threonine protein kinase
LGFLRYQIIKEIGSGSTAMVYLAQDLVLRRPIALKRLHPHLLHHAETKARFEIEALAVAGFAHENIVRLYDLVREEDRIMLAFEYVEGGNLAGLLDRAVGRLSNLTTLSLAVQLLAGLAAAHAKGIVHRDVKPGNILLTPDGLVKLSDFGIAHLAGDNSLTRTGYLLGSPQFMAPEQADGQSLGSPADIFALGIILYRCFSGVYPFRGETPQEVLAAISRCQYLPLGLVESRLLPGITEVLTQLLAKRPEDRPTASQALVRFQGVVDSLRLKIGPGLVVACALNPEQHCEQEELYLSSHIKLLSDEARQKKELAKTFKLAAAAKAFERSNERLGYVNPPYLERIKPTVGARGKAKLTLALSLILGFLFLVGATVSLRWKKYGAAKSMPVVITEPLPTSLKIARINPPKDTTRHPSPIPIKQTPARANKARAPLPTLPAVGFFKLWTQPPFADIWMDGQWIGTSPLTQTKELKSGYHRLGLRRPGFITQDSGFTLVSGDTLSWRIRLKPL